MDQLLTREMRIDGENGTDEESGDYTFRLACASEEPYERWWGIEVLDCSEKSVRLGRMNDGAPILFNHNWDELRGTHVPNTSKCEADKVLRTDARLTSATEAGRETIAMVKTGILTKSSVSYMIHSVIEQTTNKQGEKIERTIDGRTFEKILKRFGKQAEGGNVAAFRRELDKNFGAFERAVDEPTVYRVVDWEPLENSLVTVPADNTVGVGRSAEVLDPEPIIEPENPSKEQKMEKTAEQIAAEEQRRHEQERLQEEKRVNEILAVGEQHAEVDGIKLAHQAIREKKSVSEFQGMILDNRRKAASGEIKFGEGAQVKDRLEDDKKLGFKSMGDFTADVIRAALNKGVSDRLERAATVFGNVDNGPDGGYAVPPEFANNIMKLAYAEDSLLSYCDEVPVTGNTMTFPKDETTPWGSTGIYAGWEGEADQSSPKKPALGESQLKLRKLKVLVAATDELISDAPAMSAYLEGKMGEAVQWKTNDAIVNGTGSGMPLGILKAASLVTITKETGQAADSIVAKNIAKLYSRVLMGPGAVPVWLINPDAFPEIITLTLNNNPIWVPASAGFQGAPNGLLMGRPVVLTDACKTLGDAGDIVFANMAGYRAITKDGGPQMAQSMHLWFDQDVQAFRLVFRMDGQPALAAQVTPPNSTNKRSHFATIENRT
jgi:HK97 family phage major capsid protein